MAETPAVDETLKQDDVTRILDELVEAQNQSYTLGLKLLPPHEVEAIHRQYQDPKERLLQILLAFTRQNQPRPTWRVIVEALRSRSVNLPGLAARVEATHFPDSTATRDVLPETTTDTKESAATTTAGDDALKNPVVGLTALARRVEAANFPDSTATRDVVPNDTTESAANTTTAAGYGHEIRTEPSSQCATGLKPYRTPKEVEDDIHVLEYKLNCLKKRAIELLEASKLGVKDVVYELTTLSSSEIDQYKVFLKEKLKELRKSEDYLELFSHLNLHWTYLSPHFLKHLVNNLLPLNGMKSDMEDYMNDLHIFRERMPLDLFCEVGNKCIEQPDGFQKVVVKFKEVKPTKEKLTLQDIEDFRQQYGSSYQLRDFAIMLRDEVKKMSFVLTFFIPDSVIELLSTKVPRELLLKFGVTKLDVAGTCLYSASVKKSMEVAKREEEQNRKAMEDDETKSTSTEVAKSKSNLVAYLLWLFLGWAGIHHFYLRRYRQGVLWLTSFGGLFGIGYLGDIFRLQKYVHYSNKRYLFVERLRENKKYSKSGPRVSDKFDRIVSQVMFGVFYRGLLYCAIPWDSSAMNYAAIIIPWGTAFGTYMVSNVGLQQSSFWWSLLGAYIGEFFGAYIGVYFSGLLPLLSVAFFSMLCSTYGWKWREKEEDAACGKLLFVALFSFIVCLILSGSFIYCNASIKTNDGGVIKFHDVLDKFFDSGNITELYKTGGRIAISETFINIVDFYGKHRATKVLGLDPETEFEDVTKRYKQLVGDRDPDHYEDGNSETQEELMLYEDAYKVLNNAQRWKKFYDSFHDSPSAYINTIN